MSWESHIQRRDYVRKAYRTIYDSAKQSIGSRHFGKIEILHTYPGSIKDLSESPVFRVNFSKPILFAPCPLSDEVGGVRSFISVLHLLTPPNCVSLIITPFNRIEVAG